MFDKKYKKAFKILWIIMGVFIIIGMLLLYAPFTYTGGGNLGF